jgi:hypothetical protein
MNIQYMYICTLQVIQNKIYLHMNVRKKEVCTFVAEGKHRLPYFPEVVPTESYIETALLYIVPITSFHLARNGISS